MTDPEPVETGRCGPRPAGPGAASWPSSAAPRQCRPPDRAGLAGPRRPSRSGDDPRLARATESPAASTARSSRQASATPPLTAPASNRSPHGRGRSRARPSRGSTPPPGHRRARRSRRHRRSESARRGAAAAGARSAQPRPSVQPGQRRRLGAWSGGSPVSCRSRLIRSSDRRMRSRTGADALLELLDRVREVHVLRRRGWRPRGPPGRCRSSPAPARDRTGCGSARRHDASARYSRWRLTASWMKRLMIGARIASTMATIAMMAARAVAAAVAIRAAPRHPAPEREPQEEVGQDGDRADHDTDDQREPDVQLRTWDISWAMTPWSSSRSSFSSRPVVIAIDACAGSRPVANAFGAVSSMV